MNTGFPSMFPQPPIPDFSMPPPGTGKNALENLEKSRHTRKLTICVCENKVTAQLISAFVFTTQVVQCLFYLKQKFEASNYFLWPFSVAIQPGLCPTGFETQIVGFLLCGSKVWLYWIHPVHP